MEQDEYAEAVTEDEGDVEDEVAVTTKGGGIVTGPPA